MSNDDSGGANHGAAGRRRISGEGTAGKTVSDPSAGITNPITNEGPTGALPTGQWEPTGQRKRN